MALVATRRVHDYASGLPESSIHPKLIKAVFDIDRALKNHIEKGDDFQASALLVIEELSGEDFSELEGLDAIQLLNLLSWETRAAKSTLEYSNTTADSGDPDMMNQSEFCKEYSAFCSNGKYDPSSVPGGVPQSIITTVNLMYAITFVVSFLIVRGGFMRSTNRQRLYGLPTIFSVQVAVFFTILMFYYANENTPTFSGELPERSISTATENWLMSIARVRNRNHTISGNFTVTQVQNHINETINDAYDEQKTNLINYLGPQLSGREVGYNYFTALVTGATNQGVQIAAAAVVGVSLVSMIPINPSYGRIFQFGFQVAGMFAANISVQEIVTSLTANVVDSAIPRQTRNEGYEFVETQFKAVVVYSFFIIAAHVAMNINPLSLQIGMRGFFGVGSGNMMVYPRISQPRTWWDSGSSRRPPLLRGVIIVTGIIIALKTLEIGLYSEEPEERLRGLLSFAVQLYVSGKPLKNLVAIQPRVGGAIAETVASVEMIPLHISWSFINIFPPSVVEILRSVIHFEDPFMRQIGFFVLTQGTRSDLLSHAFLANTLAISLDRYFSTGTRKMGIIDRLTIDMPQNRQWYPNPLNRLQLNLEPGLQRAVDDGERLGVLVENFLNLPEFTSFGIPELTVKEILIEWGGEAYKGRTNKTPTTRMAIKPLLRKLISSFEEPQWVPKLENFYYYLQTHDKVYVAENLKGIVESRNPSFPGHVFDQIEWYSEQYVTVNFRGEDKTISLRSGTLADFKYKIVDIESRLSQLAKAAK